MMPAPTTVIRIRRSSARRGARRTGRNALSSRAAWAGCTLSPAAHPSTLGPLAAPSEGGPMKLTVVIPIISDALTEHVRTEVAGWVAPGTEVEIRLIERVGSIRVVDIPVLSLDEPDLLLDRLAEQASEAVARQEADVIVLGCTGMIGVAAALQERLAKDGSFVPVVDPTGAAMLWLESAVRLGVRPSRTTYMPPPAKDRLP